MVKKCAVVGAGINGLLAAFLIGERQSCRIDIYDAEQHPANVSDHRGTTHGSKDARHITGSESIGFENSVHKDALRNAPWDKAPGWLLKDETQLTNNEKQWRDRFEASYGDAEGLNAIDFAHAELNYKGLAAWHLLIQEHPFMRKHIISDEGVDVYFRDKTAFESDLKMETEFCSRYFKAGHVRQAQNHLFKKLYAQKLVVPGISIRVKSLALDLLRRLEENPAVHFYWGVTVKDARQLAAETIVWTSGVTHEQPSEYKDHGVQGLVGCWVTIPNRGYQRPFKIAAPTPSAYINFTSDADWLHISGGFGWLGEYTDALSTKSLAKPVAAHFVQQINTYLGTNITAQDVDYCVRSSTPTGQPLLITETSRGKKEIFITGSAKSGTTHAPVLSAYVLAQLDGR
jgi:hypothetical protein